jgi:hypothetical protein
MKFKAEACGDAPGSFQQVGVRAGQTSGVAVDGLEPAITFKLYTECLRSDERNAMDLTRMDKLNDAGLLRPAWHRFFRVRVRLR